MFAIGLAQAAIGCAPHGDRETEVEAEAAPAGTLAAPVCRAWAQPMSEAEAEAEGERDAVLDLARGVMALESYERPRRCHGELAALLHERYAIEYRSLGACAVTDALVGHARGYNAKMHAYIRARHGDAVEAAAQATGCISAPHPRRAGP